MLIFRYLARDLILSALAVCTVLLMVIVSGRFVKYLADAASGDLDPTILFLVMGYRLPGFIELILPLAFFLAIFLTYGRLYMDNEMAVLSACGISQKRLVAYTMVVAVGIASVVAWLSLVGGPAGLRKAEQLLDAQKARGELDALLPRQFHNLQQGRATTYVEAIGENGEMSEVFVAENNPEGEEGRQLVVVLADRGHQKKGEPGKGGYLVLEEGYRIQGVPGQADYQVTQFSQYGVKLRGPKVRNKAPKADTLAMGELLQSENLKHKAAVHWRLATPLLVLIVSLLAVSLSKTNPRQGRFAKMFPAILIYIIYLVALNASRDALEDGDLPIQLGMWPVHLCFSADWVGDAGMARLATKEKSERGFKLMRLLSSHVATSVFLAIAMVLTVIVSLDAIGAVIDGMGDIQNEFTFSRLLVYVGLTLPSRIYEAIPIASLIGCLVGPGCVGQ